MSRGSRNTPYQALPEELRALIEHTNEGVSRLYQTAANASLETSRQSPPPASQRAPARLKRSQTAPSARKGNHTEAWRRRAGQRHRSRDEEEEEDRYANNGDTDNEGGGYGNARSRNMDATRDSESSSADERRNPFRNPGRGRVEQYDSEGEEEEEEEVPQRLRKPTQQTRGTWKTNPPGQSRNSTKETRAIRQRHDDTSVATSSHHSLSHHHDPQPTCRLVDQRRRRKVDSSAISEDPSSLLQGKGMSGQRPQRTVPSVAPSGGSTPSRRTRLETSGASAVSAPGVLPDWKSPHPRRTNDTSSTTFTAHTKPPILSTPSAGTQSLFLSPDKLEYTEERSSPVRGAQGRGWAADLGVENNKRNVANMRTRFGQKWSQTFQSLFGNATGQEEVSEAEATISHHEETALAAPSEAVVQRPLTGHALTDNPLLQPHASTPGALATVTAPLTSSTAPSSLGVSPPSAATTGEAITHHEATQLQGLVVVKLREELRERDQDIVKLRLEHALEIAALKEKMIEARREAAAEAAQQAAAAGDVRVEVLKSSLDVEQQRASDLRGQLEELRRVHAETEEKLRSAEALSSQVSDLSKELQGWKEANEALKHSASAKDDALAEAQREMEAKQRACDAQARTADALEDRVSRLEKQLLEQEETARETLRNLEAEFTATTDSYQRLLSEATERMARLEKTQRKYKTLKEASAALKDALQSAKTTHAGEADAWAAEKVRLTEALRASQEELSTVQSSLRELSATHDAALAELRRQSEAQKLSATEQTKMLHSQLETANHTIQLLRTQVENLKADIIDEQTHSQELAMRMAETELRLQEEKQGQQRAAGSYKVQSEETIATLRRQLKEKDAQLKTLAASQAEPLHRLRSQLEEERGRRATLEQQFAQYKRKAKEAEEAALVEIRRERLRNAALISPRSTPSSRAATATATATGTASPGTATSTPKPWHARSSSGRPSGSHPSPQAATSQPRLRPTDEAHSPPQVQTTHIANEDATRLGQGHTQPQMSTIAAASSAGDHERPRGFSGSAPAPKAHPERDSDAAAAAGLARASGSPRGAHTRPRRSPGTAGGIGADAPPPSVQLFAPEHSHDNSRQAVGVDSLSGITLNSPCRSASSAALNISGAETKNAEHKEDAPRQAYPRQQRSCEGRGAPGAAAEAASALLNRHNGVTPLGSAGHASQPSAPSSALMSPAPPPSAQAGDHNVSDRNIFSGYGDLNAHTHGNWERPSYRPPSSMRETGEEEEDSQQLRAQTDGIVAEQVRENVLSGDHERRMHDFHASAAQVFQKITSSRDAFMAQCTSIVRQSTAAQRRSNMEVPVSRADSVSSICDNAEDSSSGDG